MFRCYLFTLSLLLTTFAWAGPEPELVLARGHDDKLSGVAISPNREMIATISEDGSGRLWDASGRRVVAVLNPPAAENSYSPALSSLAFSDGHLLANADKHQRIHLWNTRTGKLQHTFAAGDQPNRETLVEFRGRRLLVATRGGVLAFDLEGNRLWHYPEADAPTAMALNGDGTRLAVAVRGALHHLDPSNGQAVKVVKVEAELDALAFAPDQTRLAAAHRKGLIIFDGDQTTALDRPLYHPRLEWSSQGLWVCSRRQGQPALWRYHPEKVLLEYEGSPLVDLAVNEDLLVAARDDGSALVFENETLVGELQGSVATPTALVLAEPDFYVGYQDGSISRWSGPQGKPTRGYQCAGPVSALAVAKQQLAAACLAPAQVHLWNTSGGEVAVFKADSGVVDIAFSSDGALLACAEFDGNVTLLNAGDGSVRSTLTRDGTPTALAFHPRAQVLAVADRLGRIEEWDLMGGRRLRTRGVPGASTPVFSIAYGPDGRLLAAGDQQGVLQFYRDDSESPTKTYPVGSQAITALSFSDDGKRLAAAGVNEVVNLVELSGGKVTGTLKGHNGPVFALAFWGEKLLSASFDGSVKLWQPSEGQALANCVKLRGSDDWVVTDPRGLFDGSSQGQRLLDWRLGEQLFSLEQFFNSYYTPGLLARLLTPEKASELPQQSLASRPPAAPPRVRILTPRTGDKIEGPSATVELEITDQGGGVTEPALYVNGHRLPASRGRALTEGRHVFEAPVIEGSNVFRATAFNNDKSMESKPDWVRVSGQTAPPREPSLHLLAVGINRYQSGLSLGFAVQDAESIAASIKPGVFAQVKPTLLLDDQATKSGILEALAAVEKEALPHDALLVYLAGHGTMLGEVYYFLPTDAKVDSPETLRDSALSSLELAEALTRITASKQLVVLDSCHSGGAASLLGRFLSSRDGLSAVKAQKQLARASGTFLIAAAKAEQYAKELPELGHGLLTYSMLEGLSGDKTVTVNSLLNFVSVQVPELSQKHYGVPQNVTQFSTGQDFPLIVR